MGRSSQSKAAAVGLLSLFYATVVAERASQRIVSRHTYGEDSSHASSQDTVAVAFSGKALNAFSRTAGSSVTEADIPRERPAPKRAKKAGIAKNKVAQKQPAIKDEKAAAEKASQELEQEKKAVGKFDDKYEEVLLNAQRSFKGNHPGKDAEEKKHESSEHKDDEEAAEDNIAEKKLDEARQSEDENHIEMREAPDGKYALATDGMPDADEATVHTEEETITGTPDLDKNGAKADGNHGQDSPAKAGPIDKDAFRVPGMSEHSPAKAGPIDKDAFRVPGMPEHGTPDIYDGSSTYPGSEPPDSTPHDLVNVADGIKAKLPIKNKYPTAIELMQHWNMEHVAKKPEFDKQELSLAVNHNEPTKDYHEYLHEVERNREGLSKEHLGVTTAAIKSSGAPGDKLYDEWLSTVMAVKPANFEQLAKDADTAVDKNHKANQVAYEYIDDLEKIADTTAETYNRAGNNMFHAYGEIRGQVDEAKLAPGKSIMLTLPMSGNLKFKGREQSLDAASQKEIGDFEKELKGKLSNYKGFHFTVCVHAATNLDSKSGSPGGWDTRPGDEDMVTMPAKGELPETKVPKGIVNMMTARTKSLKGAVSTALRNSGLGQGQWHFGDKAEDAIHYNTAAPTQIVVIYAEDKEHNDFGNDAAAVKKYEQRSCGADDFDHMLTRGRLEDYAKPIIKVAPFGQLPSSKDETDNKDVEHKGRAAGSDAEKYTHTVQAEEKAHKPIAEDQPIVAPVEKEYSDGEKELNHYKEVEAKKAEGPGLHETLTDFKTHSSSKLKKPKANSSK